MELSVTVEPRQILESEVMNQRKSSTFDLSLEYGECMRNHAASTGGHATDGCGEFMPSTDDSLACAACGCHRNFHRRESPGSDQPQYHYPALYAAGRADWHLMRYHLAQSQHFRDGVGERQEMNEYDRRSETRDERKAVQQVGFPTRGKRIRTKFTPEQKEKMAAFAESIGWRMRRTDNNTIDQFCSEVGVRRSVLKVWVRNNKSGHRRKQTQRTRQSQSPSPPPTRLIGA